MKPQALCLGRITFGCIIAVLGILSVGILIALNVTGNLNKANLAKAKTFAASVENDLSIAQVGKWSFNDSANPAGESPRISAFIKTGGSWEPRVSLPTADEAINKWMHLATTYNATGGTNNFKLYKDGVLKAQTTRTGNIDVSTYNLSIGASEIGTNAISSLTDEVAIYSQSLTSYQIQHLYAQGLLKHQLARE